MNIRTLLFAAGILACLLGFHAESSLQEPNAAASLLQGALTLGGGWIICGLFMLHSKWHGIIGGGILALLAAARCAPALLDLGIPGAPGAAYRIGALVLSLVVLVTSVRAMFAERARRELERLRNGN